MPRNVAAHVRLTDRQARRSTEIGAVLARTQAILAGAGIDLEVELAYDLDEEADRVLADGPDLTQLRAERDGAAVWRPTRRTA